MVHINWHKIRRKLANLFYYLADRCEVELSLPNKMNYDLAIKAINSQSSKGKATLFYKLVHTQNKDERRLLKDYIRLAERPERREQKAAIMRDLMHIRVTPTESTDTPDPRKED